MGNAVDRINILVVLYGKALTESHTLLSLLKFDCSLFNLTIINNGPKPLTEEGAFYERLKSNFNQFELMNRVENMPLSIAYNSFIDAHPDADKYVFLDDDTELTESFISRLTDCDSSYDVETPKIISSDMSSEDIVIHYPVENNIPVSEKRNVDPGSVLSIGSGLILSRQFVLKFQAANVSVFDNHYALYGVDYSLFRKMRKLMAKGVNFEVTSFSTINHSLSRLQKGTPSKHTQRERLYDVILSARHYPDKVYITGLIKSVLCAVKNLEFTLAFHIVATFIKGYHPRCERYIVNKDK